MEKDMTMRSSKPQRAVTIYDIARAAQVSPSTVSRALSQPGRLNARTEERIRATALELNYQLNPIARALPTGRTGMLGVLVTDLTNPMFFELVRGADRAAADAGNTMMLSESQESPERELATARRMLPAIDGLILSSSRLADAQIRELAVTKPVVVINRAVPGVASIVPDVAPGISDCLGRLAAAGHTRIAFVPGPTGSWMSATRAAKIARVAGALGLDLVTLSATEPTLVGGASRAGEVLAAGASAVLAYNDLIAIGLMRAAQTRGLTVPADLSIIGFDNIFGADLTSPELTTIATPLLELGGRAVGELLGLIAEPGRADDTGAERHGATKLIVRGSARL